jgi:small-conductance mechanosensitive channel
VHASSPGFPFRIDRKVQIGGNVGTVKELTLFWTELVSDDKVQIIVPNGGVWGQALRNFSVYPAPPHAGEVRFRIPEGIELEPAIEKVRAIVEAHPRVLADPAPRVLLDHTADRQRNRDRPRVLHRRRRDRGCEERPDQGGAHRARCVAWQPAVH